MNAVDQSDTVTSLLAAGLAANGVTKVFGLMGSETAVLINAFAYEQRMQIVATRHESTAVAAADAYSWATGELGVCVLSHGPGVTNGLTAETTAVRAGSSVIILAGDDETEPRARPELKRFDQAGLAQLAGLGFVRLKAPEGICDALQEAVGNARDGKPTLLAVPSDLFLSEVPAAESFESLRVSAPTSLGLAPAPEAITLVLELLSQSKRPLILAGRGAISAERDLASLAEQTGALLGTSLRAKGLFDGHRLNIGLVGGWASDSARPLLDAFDLVLVFGASLNSFTMAGGRLFRDIPIIHVDADESRIGAHYAVDLGVVADSRVTAEQLLKALPLEKSSFPLHRPDVLEQLAQPAYLGVDESLEGFVDGAALAALLDELLPQDRAVISDVGHFSGFPGIYVRVPGPNRFRLTGDYASIGLGLGAGIGAASARPETRTVLFAGDAGLMMALGDLETVARCQIPLTIVVMNDRALGAERHLLDALGASHEFAVFGDVDFASLGRQFGIRSQTVSSLGDLRSLAGELTQTRAGPLLLDCKIRGDRPAAWMREFRHHDSLGKGSRERANTVLAGFHT